MERTELWHRRFLDLAGLVASWSKDPSTKVGAVIVRPDRTIASVGYNGFPRETRDDPKLYADKTTKRLRIVHAEANAILSARTPLSGCSLFVTELHPCSQCAGLVIQAGIKRVIHNMEREPGEAWQASFDEAARMFSEAGVRVISYPRR